MGRLMAWLRRAGLAVLGALPLGLGPHRLRGWVLHARTRRALLRARRGDTPTDAALDTLIVEARARHRLNDAAGHRTVVEQMVDRVPARRGQADLVAAEVLAAGDPDLARRYGERLADSRHRDARSVLDLRSELGVVALRRSGDEAAFRAAVAGLEALGPRWPVVTARTLAVTGDWDLLASRLAEADPARDELPVGRELRSHAENAFRAGHLSASAALAELALERDPEGGRAREVLAQVRDRLALVEHGWEPQGRSAGVVHEPRDRSVLAVLSQSLPHRSGGYATRSHGILTGLRDQGWDVAALTRLGFPYDRWSRTDTRTVAPFDVVDGVPYHRALVPGRRQYPQTPLLGYVEEFADHVTERATAVGARLVHASSFYATGLGAAEAARRLGVPFVYEMRGLEDLMHVSRDPRFAETEGHRFLSAMEVECCRAADAVFVITEALKQEMARRGVPAEKMTVLPNGVHPEHFAPVPRDRGLERELGLEGKAVIGYAGGLIHYEGLELLMAAVAELAAERADFAVVIVGDGPHEAAVRAAAGRLGVDDRVVFTGRVPHAEVTRYLSLFDITPFPRLPLPVCELISPMKPFEAMATESAVVVSSVAALTEIVRDGVTGLVFDKGDATSLAAALRRLLDSAELRAELGAAARAWVETEGSWSVAVGRADAVYRALLGEAG